MGLYILFKIITKIILKKVQRAAEGTETDVDDFTIRLIRSIKPPFYFFVSLYFASFALTLNEIYRKIILGIFIITVVIQGAVIIQQIIDYVIRKRILKPGETDPGKEAIIKFVGQLAKAAVWVAGFLLILANLGVNVTALVAGLGILSIGIGLATKDIISDMFASVSILVDKPFVPGDKIGIAGKEKEQGTVKKIGIKTTQLKTKDGHNLLIANRKLTSSSIQNFKKRGKRRVTINLAIAYGISSEKLEQVPELVIGILEKHNSVEDEKVMLKEFGQSSLNFEVSFSVKPEKDKDHLKTKEQILYEIFQAFEKEGIKFAQPVQLLPAK